MNGKGSQVRMLSPTKVTAWLDCAHYLNLAHQVADGFVQSMPGSLESLCESVPGKDLTNLKDRTVQLLVRVVGDYLP